MVGYITTVRGKLLKPDPEEAMQLHNDIVARTRVGGEPLGGIAHMVFANAQDPQEFLAVDGWTSIEGLQQLMGDPSVQAEIGSMFAEPPQVTIWKVRDGWTRFGWTTE
jgi:quinol monooxygenase YgiN